MTTTSIFLFIIFIIQSVLGLLIITKGKDKKAKLSFAFFCFSFAIWTLSYFLLELIPNNQDITVLFKTVFIGPSFIVLFTYFTYVFPDKEQKVPSILFFVIFPILFLLLLPTNFYLESAYKTINGQIIVKQNFGILLFWAYFILSLLVGLWNLVRKSKLANKANQQGIKYIFFGLFAACLFWVALNILIPILNLPKLLSMEPISATFVFIAVAFAIIKHGFMDIQIVINRIGAYSAIITSIVISVLITMTLSSSLYINTISTIIMCVIWGLLGDKLRDKLQTAADKKWVSDYYQINEVIKGLTHNLAPDISRTELIQRVADNLQGKVECKEYSLLIANSDDQGEVIDYYFQSAKSEEAQKIKSEDKIISYFSHRPKPCLYKHLEEASLKSAIQEKLNISKYSVFLPLHSAEALEGVIILGQRKSEVRYSKKDLDLFESIINTVFAYLNSQRPYEKLAKEYQKNKEYTEKIYEQASYAEITRGIAHEVNNPMGILLGNSELLADVADQPDQVREIAQILKEEIARVISITETMMQYGGMKVEKTIIDISATIQGLVRLCRADFRKNNIKIETKLEENLPQIKGDKNRLDQVFINLSLNAAQAMENQDEKILTIKAHRTSFVSKEGHKKEGLEVQISDNGKGISQENQERIFNAFFTTKYQGLGLGLALSLKIIDEHDGLIKVESTLGQGTSFKVYLPIS
jgi:signal transduction histidine kinase